MLKVFFVAFSFLLLSSISSADCGCVPSKNYGNKKYQLFEKTWYGTKRHWSCEYICEREDGSKEKVVGYYKDWYTKDQGLEGICEGLVYQQEYSQFKGWFVWMLEGTEMFVPSKSKSEQIRTWASSNCQK